MIHVIETPTGYIGESGISGGPDYSKEIIHVIGDSHVMLFTGQRLPFLIKSPINFKPIGYDLIPGFVTYFCALLRAYHMIDNHYFWQLVDHISKESTIILVLGEIDCRGPILNESYRTGISIENITKLCVNRYLIGARRLKEKGFNPIIFAPYAQRFLTEIKHDWVLLPKYLTPQEWCQQKDRAVTAFESLLRLSEFPVVSLNDWIFSNQIQQSDEYWLDPIHLSDRVWPIIEKELATSFS
jgi:hypothetical protein